ncbi:tail fiber domain-containing protein [Pseudomonas alloputida]|uniref:tail fiber domain-containing protein n=1 Tax=Pseudomonas alloputida TaxID=1940621 RepID=UPI001E46FFCF|nr:tail fiber domain-containing protein [Pseudomonas alloputida]MCE1054124.1 tail fiber domain-containing protein [Pseudomonas alloputida]
MELKNFFAQDEQGNVLGSAICYLYQRGSETIVAGLQDGTGAALSNPFVADTMGVIRFAAPNGLYDLRVVKGNRDYRIPLQMADLREVVAEAAAQADRAGAEADRSEFAVAEADKFTQPSPGTVVRSLREKMRDVLSIRDFGAIGDGVYHPLSERFATLAEAQTNYFNVGVTSLLQSIDWAATQSAINAAKINGRQVYGPSGGYVLTDGIYHPPGVRFYGDGQIDSPATMQDAQRLFIMSGCCFMYYGTGPRTHVANLAACDGSTTGDKYVNLSTYEPEYDSTYSMTSFWNHDADPVTGAAATQRKFSCGWKVEKGGFSQLRDVTLIPYFDGIDGYNSTALQLAADWDIGLWVDNHHDFYCHNVSTIGYWRMAGTFGRTSIGINEAPSPDFERNKFSHCLFQGFASFLLRGADQYPIKAVGSDYIDIEWFDSHPFSPSFDNSIRTQEYGGLFCTYSGTQKVGNYLRLTGVTPSPAAIDVNNTSNKVILGRRTNGVADASWDNCYFFGLNHRMARATSAALGAQRYNTPSRCIEFGGASMRGLKLNDSCKVMSCDDIALYLGNVLQFEYNGSFESKDVEGRGIGIRLVGGLNAYQVRLGQKLRGSGGTDARPSYPTTDGRFRNANDTGMFNPNQAIWDGWSYGVSGHVDIRPGSNQRVAFCRADGTPVLYVSPDGEFNYITPSGARGLRYLPSTDTWSARSNILNLANAAGQNRVSLSVNDVNLAGNVTRVYNQDSTTVLMRLDGSTTLFDFAGTIRPDADNTRSLGAAARRFTTVYASNTAISNSDARLKTPVRKLTTAEVAAALELAREFGIWQWLERVQSEGDDARLHTGMTVQRAIEILLDHGLTPMEYSFICYDKWDDEYEDRPAIYEEDEEGNQVEIKPAERALTTKAGDIYSFRMTELQSFILAAQVQQYQDMRSDILGILERLEMLER